MVSFFTASSFGADARERRITNLMEIAHSHRDLWLQLVEKPELARKLRSEVDLQRTPVSVVEERFVHLLVIHLSVCIVAMKSGVLPSLSRLEDDVRGFVTLPIPCQVMGMEPTISGKDFVAFVDSTIGQSEATVGK